jgi:hypothetical protein
MRTRATNLLIGISASCALAISLSACASSNAANQPSATSTTAVRSLTAADLSEMALASSDLPHGWVKGRNSHTPNGLCASMDSALSAPEAVVGATYGELEKRAGVALVFGEGLLAFPHGVAARRLVALNAAMKSGCGASGLAQFTSVSFPQVGDQSAVWSGSDVVNGVVVIVVFARFKDVLAVFEYLVQGRLTSADEQQAAAPFRTLVDRAAARIEARNR